MNSGIIKQTDLTPRQLSGQTCDLDIACKGKNREDVETTGDSQIVKCIHLSFNHMIHVPSPQKFDHEWK